MRYECLRVCVCVCVWVLACVRVRLRMRVRVRIRVRVRVRVRVQVREVLCLIWNSAGVAQGSFGLLYMRAKIIKDTSAPSLVCPLPTRLLCKRSPLTPIPSCGNPSPSPWLSFTVAPSSSFSPFLLRLRARLPLLLRQLLNNHGNPYRLTHPPRLGHNCQVHHRGLLLVHR